jgi:hypothetical protein
VVELEETQQEILVVELLLFTEGVEVQLVELLVKEHLELLFMEATVEQQEMLVVHLEEVVEEVFLTE